MFSVQQHVQPQRFSSPFDAVAHTYDETFTSSGVGNAQRTAVWSELSKAFHAGDRVLEIGCGTGVDACYLAERGVEVFAFDPSPQMIEVADQRVMERGFQDLVRTQVLHAEDISTLKADQPFDGVFSNFGALNCVADLKVVAQGLATLLKPGATALLCWMGPYCLWEIGAYLSQANTAKAFRRMHRDGISARIADGAFLHVHYPSVRSLACAFSPDFRIKMVRGIGVAVPPSYMEPWARRHPTILKLCSQFDSWFGRCPSVRLLGDHVLVQLQRVSQ
jgi:ubiquinone/menaquinone biosynthesis C-methylase UbiE